jgi:hypothetical protein
MTKLDVSIATNILRDDNLVWSADMDSIRLPLADLIDAMATAIDAANSVMGSVSSPYGVDQPKVCKCSGSSCACKGGH